MFDFITPFVSSTKTIFNSCLDADITRGNVEYTKKHDHVVNLAVGIDFFGQSSGTIFLKMNDETALKICHIMAENDKHEHDIIDPDILKELANMITGKAITVINNMGYRFVVSPPRFLATIADIEQEHIVVPITIPLQSTYGLIIIRIEINSD